MESSLRIVGIVVLSFSVLIASLLTLRMYGKRKYGVNV